MKSASENVHHSAPLAILVNGPSSSGKSTLCNALQQRLTSLSAGDLDVAFARVAFDDFLLLSANFDGSSGNIETVPEPDKWIIVMLASLGLYSWFVRKRRGYQSA